MKKKHLKIIKSSLEEKCAGFSHRNHRTKLTTNKKKVKIKEIKLKKIKKREERYEYL